MQTMRVPWARVGSGFTLLFKRLSNARLHETPPTAVEGRFCPSWDVAHSSIARAVRHELDRRQPTFVTQSKFDEKTFVNRHQYVSVVVDQDNDRILYVADDRQAVILALYFNGPCEAQQSGITVLAMQMWESYRKTLQALVPDAARNIAVNTLLVMQHVNAAVGTVRKSEHRTQAAAGTSPLS